MYIWGFRTRQRLRSLAPIMNDDWRWEWWPNDIRETLEPKASWHLSYRWGKTLKKSYPGNLSWPGIEPGPAAWQARMLPPGPQRWTSSLVKLQTFVPKFTVEDLPLDRTAALVPEFAVKDLPLGRTLWWWCIIITLTKAENKFQFLTKRDKEASQWNLSGHRNSRLKKVLPRWKRDVCSL